MIAPPSSAALHATRHCLGHMHAESLSCATKQLRQRFVRSASVCHQPPAMFPVAPLTRKRYIHAHNTQLFTHTPPTTMAKGDTKTPIIVGSLVVVAVAIGATLFVKKGGMESDGTYTCAYLPTLGHSWRSVSS